jgi:hypothetical protein
MARAAQAARTTKEARPGPSSRGQAGLEHTMCITEEHIPFHVVAVLRVEGPRPLRAGGARRPRGSWRQVPPGPVGPWTRTIPDGPAGVKL